MQWAYIRIKEKFGGPIFGGEWRSGGWGEWGVAYIWGGGIIFGRKTLCTHLQSVKLTFLSFFQYIARTLAFLMSCKI